MVVNKLPPVSTLQRKWQTGIVDAMLGDGRKDVLVMFGDARRPTQMPVDALTLDLTPPRERRSEEHGHPNRDTLLKMVRQKMGLTCK